MVGRRGAHGGQRCVERGHDDPLRRRARLEPHGPRHGAHQDASPHGADRRRLLQGRGAVPQGEGHRPHRGAEPGQPGGVRPVGLLPGAGRGAAQRRRFLGAAVPLAVGAEKQAGLAERLPDAGRRLYALRRHVQVRLQLRDVHRDGVPGRGRSVRRAGRDAARRRLPGTVLAGDRQELDVHRAHPHRGRRRRPLQQVRRPRTGAT